MPPELAVERREIVEAAFKGDRANRDIRSTQSPLGMFDRQPTQMPNSGFTSDLCEQLCESASRHFELFGRRVDRGFFE